MANGYEIVYQLLSRHDSFGWLCGVLGTSEAVM